MVARGLRALGVDPDIIPLTMARRRIIGATFLRASGNALPFPDGSMDGILSECVLSIMPDRPKALTEWRRVLREGGRLAFSDVYARRHDGTGQTSPGEGVLLSADHLRHLVAEAGFTVTHFEDRSDLLRAWVGRFIFQYGSLDALWGDAATAKGLKALAPGYCMLIATKPVHGWSKPN
jgi:ubiquinone/menaquinone biosynthesis C-methylase UbiE